MNATELIGLVKNTNNPEQIVMQFLQTQMQGTPMGDNLINMVKQGNNKGIEEFARNFLKQNGIDFDKEFKAFRSQWGL